MKYALLLLVIVIPIFTFAMGYSVGDGRVIYVQPDASVARVTQEKNIGQVAGVAVIKPTPSPSSSPNFQENENKAEEDMTKTVSQNEGGLWGEVNVYRANHGLPPFAKDASLCGFSGTRLGQVQSAGHINHDGFQALLDTYLRQGYMKISENLAQGFSNPHDVISSWDGSAGHKALLQGADLDRGCSSEGGGFVVLIAGKK